MNLSIHLSPNQPTNQPKKHPLSINLSIGLFSQFKLHFYNSTLMTYCKSSKKGLETQEIWVWKNVDIKTV